MISCNLFIFFTFYFFISCTSELWLVTLLCSLLLLCFLLLHGEKLWIFYLKVLSFTCLSQVSKSPLPILVFGKSCIFGFFFFSFFFMVILGICLMILLYLINCLGDAPWS